MATLEPGTRVRVGDDRQPGTIATREPPAYSPNRPYTYTVAMDDGTTRADVPAHEVHHAHETTVDPVEIVRRVALAEFVAPDREWNDQPAPTLTDDLDALAQVADARTFLGYDEARLIDAARTRGATWEQIGLALGSPPTSAKQRAQQRAHRRRSAMNRPT